MQDALVIRSVARPGRSAVHLDAVEARLVAGQWHAPKVGDVVVTGSGSEQRWEAATNSEPGVLKASAARGGYVYWPVPSDREQVMILEAAGHNCVYVNGEIRGGDGYGFGYVRLPVRLREGTNDFLFQSGRGDLKAKLVAAPEALEIQVADMTLPDLILGETEPVWGSAVLLNATTRFLHASLRADGGQATQVTIPPLGSYKTPFLLRPPATFQTNSYSATLEAVDISDQTSRPVRAQVSLRVRRSDQVCARTFVSPIDDSVQYFAVNPPSSSPDPKERPALFLSLHGASVEARGQAEAYSPKAWGPIVCPTNRRPYGFDWEEWGRWDAMEVLQLAKAQYHPDPQRIYLTGHSMGGHGTWQLGAIFPDQFAAIGPSAGWISFNSYAERGRAAATNAMQRMLRRAAAASDTLLLATNYLQEGVYILHGDADDNVPVSEAREMNKVLGGFHHDFQFYEQPGAGHWWDASDEPGADCVDWAPMFDFFAHRIIPLKESVRQIRFATVNPAVSSRAQWVTIVSQEHSLELSAVDVRCDPGARRVTGSTTNVSRLRLEFPTIAPGPGLTIELDGQKLAGLAVPGPAEGKPSAAHLDGILPSLELRKHGESWQVEEDPGPALKRPERSGPFREAFRNHMALVYATQGTREENAWSLAKARYDAEAFSYRGNASIELIADVDAVAQDSRADGRPEHRRARNLILYGHAECNAAWASLLSHSPVQVHRGRVTVGDHTWEGEELGCLFLQPHPQDPEALVGIVAGSGMPGLRVTERMPYFISGAGFPDCLLFRAELPTKGVEAVLAAGFFGEDWQVRTGDFVWGEPR